MPSYSSDKVLIATSVDVLFAQNMLTYNEVVDISLADDNTKTKLLDRKLTTMSSSTAVCLQIFCNKYSTF